MKYPRLQVGLCFFFAFFTLMVGLYLFAEGSYPGPIMWISILLYCDMARSLARFDGEDPDALTFRMVWRMRSWLKEWRIPNHINIEDLIDPDWRQDP